MRDVKGLAEGLAVVPEVDLVPVRPFGRVLPVFAPCCALSHDAKSGSADEFGCFVDAGFDATVGDFGSTSLDWVGASLAIEGVVGLLIPTSSFMIPQASSASLSPFSSLPPSHGSLPQSSSMISGAVKDAANLVVSVAFRGRTGLLGIMVALEGLDTGAEAGALPG